jgi:hypothetical protein
VIGILILALFGCGDYGLTTAPKEPDPDEGKPLEVKKKPVRVRQALLPGTISWPPPPEAGLDKSQCNDLSDGGPLLVDDCVTNMLKCNETIIGHTIGGVQRYDTKFYEKHFCTPGYYDYNGGDERIYRLDVPDHDHIAVVTMDSPCADLDLAGFKWKDKTCPQTNHLFDYCEMWPKDGNKREQIRLVSQSATSFYVVVEGKGGEEGPFSLTVQCRDAVH